VQFFLKRLSFAFLIYPELIRLIGQNKYFFQLSIKEYPCMQNPSVRGLQAVSNHCTVAHITVLLVALTSAKTGNKDKIRLVESFLPNV